MKDRLPPLVAGRFELKELLGRGSMGVVHRAHDLELRRDVALKVVHEAEQDPVALARFRREGKIAASLHHPGLLPIYSTGVLEGRPYLVYELVREARELHTLFPALSLAERVRLVRDAARALGAAHAAGVVHRDVKPHNLLVDAAGRLVVADFGLATAGGLERLTRTGTYLGTPSYIAPEQLDARRGPSSPASDTWSLGVVLYEALCGVRPFPGPSLLELAAQISQANPRPPRVHRRDLPPELEAICLRCLRLDPAERFPQGEALAQALDVWLERGGGRGRRLLRVRLSFLALVGVALLLAALLVFGPRERRLPVSQAAWPRSSPTPSPSPPADRPASLGAAERIEGTRRLRELRELPPARQMRAGEAWLKRFAAHPRAGEVRRLLETTRRTSPRFVLREEGDPDPARGWLLEPAHALTRSPAGQALLWDLRAEPRVIRRWPGLPDRLRAAAFDPRTGRLFLGDEAGTLHRFAPAGIQSSRRSVGEDPIISLRVGPRGEQLAVGIERALWLFPLDARGVPGEGRHIAGHHGLVRQLLFSPDGARIIVGVGERGLRASAHAILIYEATGGRRLLREVLSSFPSCLRWDPAGERFACGTQTGRLLVFDRRPGAPQPIQAIATRDYHGVFAIAHTDTVVGVVFSPDGRRLYSLAEERKKRRGELKVWSYPEGRELRRLGLEFIPTGVEITPDGRHLLIGSVSGEVQVWLAE